MSRRSSRVGLVLIVAAGALVALAATAAARSTATEASPITIGWAYDSKGAMAPFDNPALAAAQLRVKQDNGNSSALLLPGSVLVFVMNKMCLSVFLAKLLR